MNKKLIFLIWLFFIGHLIAQNGKIIGTVVDKETGEALPGCNIFIEGLMIGAASDADGSFIILNVPPGDYGVIAKMVGYRDVMQEGVTVVTNLTTKIDFELSQEAIEVEEVTIVDYKNPPVQKDLTSKIQVRTSDEIERIPKVTVQDLLTQQAGVMRWGRALGYVN